MTSFLKLIPKLSAKVRDLLHELRLLPGNNGRISELEMRTSIVETNLLFNKVSRFLVCEKIHGDYFEFGVFRGDTFARFYQQLDKAFCLRISQNNEGKKEEKDRKERMGIWNSMRFFAFDSFKGLPALSEEDSFSQDFAEGQYAFSLEEFQTNIQKQGVPLERVVPVPGWFENTCNAKTANEHKIEKAAVVFIDCDLYSSTKTVLEFIGNYLQDGTVLIFDDWFSYRGHPRRGEQKAFYEWASSDEISTRFQFVEYQKDLWKRNSFIVNEILEEL